MIDFSYFQRGLAALARAHPVGGMAGHLGSSVMAGYFFSEIHTNLVPGVKFAIERDLERIIGGEEAIWYNQKKEGIRIPELFEPPVFEPAGAEGEKAAGKVAEALSQNINTLRQSGHNTIFGSIAIRGLREHPELGSEKITDGLVRLMATFDRQGPGRAYFGKAEGWKQGGQIDVSRVPEPKYDDLEGMAVATLEEVITSSSKSRRGLGGLHHLIDHAAAIVELADQGFSGLAERGIKAQRRHLRMMQALPVLNEELGTRVAAKQDPLTPEYWERRNSVQFSAWLTHRIKSLYGFSILAGLVEDEELTDRASGAMRYLLA
ncbi:MAG: hypothetical protein P1V20_19555 [Verrucomicrobiales bacterium]|nr:hypothetical protein [Verrucomicrobiales bacterium]